MIITITVIMITAQPAVGSQHVYASRPTDYQTVSREW